MTRVYTLLNIRYIFSKHAGTGLVFVVVVVGGGWGGDVVD